MKKSILFLILILSFEIASCDTRDFVYYDQKTFQSQLSYSKNGFVETVLQLDPTKKGDNKFYANPWLITKEKKFTGRNKLSDEIWQLIINAVDRKQRYTGEGWYPTYEIYIKYSVRYLYLIRSEKYLSILIDLKNSHIFIEGRKFVLTDKEVDLLKVKLDILLD